MGSPDSALGPGQTPLTDEEKLGLKPGYIRTVGELNEWEYENILRGQEWALSRRRKDILSESFIKILHEKMFGDVWEWAGEYRKSDKNVGVPAYQIPTELREVLDSIRFWEKEKSFDLRDIAIRLHHRVVKVHPFVNGNGRHSRFLADLFLLAHRDRPFTWGGGANLQRQSDSRSQYLNALQQADALNYGPLRKFADN